ncbi:MAG TPA: class II glutamine amidotransferase [Microlunatus sp.]|nr:class II glutamine amidotransferase [Microlunatus sp.]
MARLAVICCAEGEDGSIEMCRWLGYRGEPIVPYELMYAPERSLIEQSRRHAPGMAVPNGDGTGLGWYGNRDTPALFRTAQPAWGNDNLHEVAAEVRSRLFLAHVRAGTGTPVQDTNCHPFRWANWLFVHNGYIAEYERLRRELLLAVDQAYFGNITGSTDSELMFHLALGLGLTEDPLAGIARMAGLVEDLARRSGVSHPALQMTIGLSDGDRLWAVRYASDGEVNSLFVSEDVEAVRRLYPERERFQHFSPGARVVVSEPLVALPGLWHEVPAGTALVVADQLEEHPFAPLR